jgi:hypothetical protein
MWMRRGKEEKGREEKRMSEYSVLQVSKEDEDEEEIQKAKYLKRGGG